MIRAACVALLTLTLPSCAQPPDNPDRRHQAEGLAEQYLSALVGSEADRGWSLLHSTAREEWGTEQIYVEAVEDADWSAFAFAVLEALYCDDGMYCTVALELPNGPGSIPEAFRSPHGRNRIGIIFREQEGLPGDAELHVVLSDILRGEGGVAPAGG